MSCAQGDAVAAVAAAELIKPHLSHICQKIEPGLANPRYILAVRGTGYLLAAAQVTS